MSDAASIFSTLAQQDTQRMQHDQSIAQPQQQATGADQIFAHMAANNGQPPQVGAKQPQGPTIGPQPKSSQFDPDIMSSDPFERMGYRMVTPFARKLIDAADKLREVENFTQEGRKEHPIQAHLGDVANRIEGFLFGNEAHPEAGIGTGKYGMLNNPVLAAVSGAEGLAEAPTAIREGIAGLRGAGEASEAAKGPSLVKQVLKGKEVAQEPAKAAIRGAVGAKEDASLLEGNKTVLDEHLKDIATKERAAYKAQDEAAGFDVKETRAKLREAEWKIKQPEIDDAARERLTKTIEESKQQIGEAEKRMSEAGVDPKAADNLFKQRKAGEDFKKALVQNVSADGESVNVDGLLNAAKKLRFAKNGDRLEQFMGKDGATEFMAKLQKAQEQGVHALKTQQFVKEIAKYIGYGGGAAAAGGALMRELSKQ